MLNGIVQELQYVSTICENLDRKVDRTKDTLFTEMLSFQNYIRGKFNYHSDQLSKELKDTKEDLSRRMKEDTRSILDRLTDNSCSYFHYSIALWFLMKGKCVQVIDLHENVEKVHCSFCER